MVELMQEPIKIRKKIVLIRDEKGVYGWITIKDFKKILEEL